MYSWVCWGAGTTQRPCSRVKQPWVINSMHCLGHYEYLFIAHFDPVSGVKHLTCLLLRKSCVIDLVMSGGWYCIIDQIINRYNWVAPGADMQRVFWVVQDSSIGDVFSDWVSEWCFFISTSSEHYRAVKDKDKPSVNSYQAEVRPRFRSLLKLLCLMLNWTDWCKSN